MILLNNNPWIEIMFKSAMILKGFIRRQHEKNI